MAHNKTIREMELLMMTLAAQLGTVTGKEKYGYLPKAVKKTVNEIVDQMEQLPVINECCQVWWELRFFDTRRFGRFWLIRAGEGDTYSVIAKLGLELFDVGMTADYWRSCFNKQKKAVKGCLLDQNVIAGIGNIYSDEILFATKLHPARLANSLTDRIGYCLSAPDLKVLSIRAGPPSHPQKIPPG